MNKTRNDSEGASSFGRRGSAIAFGSLAILVAAIFFGMAVSSVTAGQGDFWEIVRAEYGTNQRHVDVTDNVRRLLREYRNEERAPVNNQTMGGDPAVGADKVLRIWAQDRRHQEREFDYKEGGWIETNLFAVRSDRWDDGDWERNDERDHGLPIIRGFYGAQGQTVNVTELLRSRVRDGVLQVHVDNGSLGGDPAVGRDKVLIVIYIDHGREQATSIREGNTLRIP